METNAARLLFHGQTPLKRGEEAILKGKQKQDRRRFRGDLPSEDHDICNRKVCGESGDNDKVFKNQSIQLKENSDGRICKTTCYLV